MLQLDEQELQEFYNHEYLLDLVGDSPLITCKEKYIEDSFSFLKEINAYARAIHHGRMHPNYVSARASTSRLADGFSVLLGNAGKAARRTTTAAAEASTGALGKVGKMTASSNVLARNAVGEVKRGNRITDFLTNSRKNADGDLSNAVGVNNQMDAAVRSSKNFDDLEAGEGAVFGRTTSTNPFDKGTKKFKIGDGNGPDDYVEVPYVRNGKGNVQLDLDNLDPNEYGKLQRKLLQDKEGFVRNAWDNADTDTKNLIKRISGEEVTESGRIRKAPIPGDSLWDSVIIKRNEIVNKSMFKAIIRRNTAVTHKMGFDEDGFGKVAKVVKKLGSKETVHLPTTDVGYMAARGSGVEDAIKRVDTDLHNKALDAIKKEGVESATDVVDVEFRLELEVEADEIRIQPFKRAIEKARIDGDNALADHLTELENAKRIEMTDPNVNKRMDASGLIDGKKAGDKFNIDEFKDRWKKAAAAGAADQLDDLASMGAMKHQFGPNTKTLSDAPKYISIEAGTANKMQMIYQVKAQPSMSKKMMKSMDFYDKNPKKKAKAFADMAYDVCGKAECSKAEWNKFNASEFYQSAGIHWGSGLPVDGGRYVPDLEIRSRTFPNALTATTEYTRNAPKLIRPDIKGWSSKGATNCVKKNDCIVLTGDGKGFKNVDVKNRGDLTDQARSWAFEKTANNVCTRNPKRCLGAFVLALGGIGAALAENWISCDDRFFPVENKLLLPENVCEPLKDCDPEDPVCAKIQENYPWVCANTVCASGKSPEKDCCTTDVRQQCYQHCLPRNYAETIDTGIGATSAVIYKKLNGEQISSWCMEPYHYSAEEAPRGCQLDISATTNVGIENGTKCMSIANKYESELAKDSEWRHLRRKLAFPGQVKDKNNKPLPWATHKDWAEGGACNKPDYNTNAIMLEHLLYHKGCGSIQHNMRTKENWSRDLFEKDTGIQLPPGAVCDFSPKDFDELIVQDNAGTWVDNEIGLFEGQPYCDEDVTKDDCRDYCWNMCSGIDYDLSKYYTILEQRSDDSDKTLIDSMLMKFAIIAGVIGACIVAALLFFSSSGPSEEERLMEELEG